MTNANKTGLVVTAHPGDFVWRAGGAIALHARKGYRIKIACLSFGERGESQFAWKESGATLEKVKSNRRDEAQRAAEMLGAEIEFFDAGDYPLRLTEAHFDRMVDIYRELNPSFVLTHALEDPYNFDHPGAAHFAQETRVVAQAMGHKPGAGVPVRTAPARAVQFQAAGDPQHRRGLGSQAQDLRDSRGAEAFVGLL
jgi:4-oxalomesaconate hydratase